MQRHRDDRAADPVRRPVRGSPPRSPPPGTQINVYYPNDIGNEPLGTCRTADTFDLISVVPKPGFEANASGFVNRTVLAQPGIFMDFRAPASDGGVPAG